MGVLALRGKADGRKVGAVLRGEAGHGAGAIVRDGLGVLDGRRGCPGGAMGGATR